ncbi:75_t:CDS:1 [Ambispora gerdemannii]|uniref:75_t:CDS:1 n=1 Tax=Ambispora gerdemannii TaxID=144530 RepID=A0A9N9FHP5_9GLOM|nr:75_t:CDS:1 [Ambispora gerdemannii]
MSATASDIMEPTAIPNTGEVNNSNSALTENIRQPHQPALHPVAIVNSHYEPRPTSHLTINVNAKMNRNVHPLAAKSVQQPPQGKSQMVPANNPLHFFVPKYNDLICIHMYNHGFIGGLYSDVSLQVNHPAFHQFYRFHAINIARSPTIRNLLTNSTSKEITLNLNDTNITSEGLGICFAHMYASSLHWINPINVKSVFAAAYHLGLTDICAFTIGILKNDISINTVIYYIKFFQHYKEYTKPIEDLCYVFLIRKLPRLLQSFKSNPNNHLHVGQNVCILKSGIGYCHNSGYHELLNNYAKLPFSWIKRILESKNLDVTTNIRYKLAKDLIWKRKELEITANNEFVYMSFGTSHYQNITIVEKPRDPQKESRRVLFKVGGLNRK